MDLGGQSVTMMSVSARLELRRPRALEWQWLLVIYAALFAGTASANMGSGMMGGGMMGGGMMGGMAWIGGIIGLLVIVLLILAIAALIKYLFRK